MCFYMNLMKCKLVTEKQRDYFQHEDSFARIQEYIDKSDKIVRFDKNWCVPVVCVFQIMIIVLVYRFCIIFDF
jgi:hypothetical protein